MSEFEKMRAGEIYNPRDLKLIYMYDKTARRLHRYNKRCFHVYNMRSRLMKKLLIQAVIFGFIRHFNVIMVVISIWEKML